MAPFGKVHSAVNYAGDRVKAADDAAGHVQGHVVGHPAAHDDGAARDRRGRGQRVERRLRVAQPVLQVDHAGRAEILAERAGLGKSAQSLEDKISELEAMIDQADGKCLVGKKKSGVCCT